jgi:hypothetical protein
MRQLPTIHRSCYLTLAFQDFECESIRLNKELTRYRCYVLDQGSSHPQLPSFPENDFIRVVSCDGARTGAYNPATVIEPSP